MYHYGKRSMRHYITLDPDLQLIGTELLLEYDHSIICGHRTVAEQQRLYSMEPPRTQIDGITIKGKHNFNPSKAMDIVPYKKGYDPFKPTEKNYARFYFMMGIVRGIVNRLIRAKRITHDVRFGLDWNRNDIFTDQVFHDLPHIELVYI